MSIYDTMDIAEWEAKRHMSCIYCKFYTKIGCPCRKGIPIQTTMEDLDCKDYKYNGSVKK